MDATAKIKFHQGELYDAYRYMGCQYDAATGCALFRVWAPRAKAVSLVGDFNGWDPAATPMKKDDGIWEVQAAVKPFDGYKYYIKTKAGGFYKSDPYAYHAETRAGTNSKVWPQGGYAWSDGDYLARRRTADLYHGAVNIYEAHIGSWRRYEDGNCFDYRKFADEIVPYLQKMHYTHLELMGVGEYPFDGSWGYQVTGYYAPTSRYGTPDDFCYLVDRLHAAGIGIILDWVPGHFPKDAMGLYLFDGQPLYEPLSPLRREHREWGTCCFDYGRGEVQTFLVANAMMWLDVYHADGLRVDAVASMLYLDYGRKAGEWETNAHGGKENIEAVAFLQKLNTAVFAAHEDVMMIAEESTAWPCVTKPVSVGGLGFNFKWNMGWMNDTLGYAKTDPVMRGGNHNALTFSLTYAYSENYILPISHDEVVHGKGSLVGKMPGAYEMKFAGWRNYLMNMYGHPGKKLLFMGCEFAQFSEWDFARALDWQLLDYPAHLEAQAFACALGAFYLAHPALYEVDDGFDGFRWLVVDDHAQNVIAYERLAKNGDAVTVIINFSGLAYNNYRFGAARGVYSVALVSDAAGWRKPKGERLTAQKKPSHGSDYSLEINLPAMSGIYLTRKGKRGKQ